MNFAEKLLKLFGWTVTNHLSEGMPKKAVMIAAPHTSLLDFVIGFLAYKVLHIKAKYLIKKEAFFFPFAGLLKKLGGIPVDRYSKNSIVEDVIELFNSQDDLIITITPEATRRRVETWKDGYHRIAKGAKVPVAIGYFDFKNKRCGIKQLYDLQGDATFDTLQIMELYRGIEGKHPEKFYLPPEK